MPQSSSIITSVKNIYNQIGLEFSTSRQYLWPDLKPFLQNLKPNCSILDLGCGNGRLIKGLPQSCRYTGLDISDVLLQQAHKKHPHHQFLEADITQESTWQNLPQFDYIYSIAVFHHLPTLKDQLFVLKQIKKHLKPQGKVLITAWNLWQPQYLKYHFDLKTKLQNLHHVYIPFQGQPRFCFAFTQGYLRRLCKRASFQLKIGKTKRNYLLSN